MTAEASRLGKGSVEKKITGSESECRDGKLRKESRAVAKTIELLVSEVIIRCINLTNHIKYRHIMWSYEINTNS